MVARRLDAVWRGILRSRGDIPSYITGSDATPSAVMAGPIIDVRRAGGGALGGGRDGADGASAGPDRAGDAGRPACPRPPLPPPPRAPDPHAPLPPTLAQQPP